jgi:outer membrane protein assembly factor BamA
MRAGSALLRRLWIIAVLFAVGSPTRADPTPSGSASDSLAAFTDATVRRVTWSGNRVTKDHVIERELETKVGEPFDPETVRSDIVRLENLDIFAHVEAVPSSVPDGVAVDYRVVEMPSYVPYPAFRYTEENGWSVGLALSAGNLTGRDVSLAGRALFGGTTTFVVSASDPWIAADYLSIALDASRLVRDDKLRDFEETSWEITPWVGTYVGRHGRVAGTFGWFQMQSDRDSITLTADNRDNFVRLGARLGYDTRDSWRSPHHGWKNELELLHTGGWLGGDGDYWSGTLDLQRYQPLGRHTLAVGLLTGLQSGTVGTTFPKYFQYTMGGANSIRGYDIDKLGREIFGKNQLIGTIEYQHTVIPIRALRILRWSFSFGLQAAAFGDIGTAWDTRDQFDAERFRVGGGIGLRLIVPNSEMVRLDLGFGRNSVVLHFAPWSKFTAQRFRLR